MFLGVIDVEHWPEMSEGFNSIHICKYIVGNKAERWISKRVLQENKARQTIRKTNISYPLIRTCTSAYQGVKNVHFWEIWRALFSWNTRFEIRPSALLPTIYLSAGINGHQSN